VPKIVVQYWGKRGAGPLFFYHSISALSAKKSEIFISYASWINFDIQLFNQYTSHQNIAYSREGKTGFLITFLLAPFSVLSFVRFIRKNHIDLVFCPMANPFSPLLGYILSLLQIPYLMIVHDASPHQGESNMFSRWLSRATLRWSSAYLVLSNDVRLQLALNPLAASKRIFQVSHGPLYAHKNAKPKELLSGNVVRLLFLGRIRAYKGLAHFIGLIQRLRALEYPVLGIVAGDGPLSIEEQRILSGSDGFELRHHWLSEEEVNQLLSEVHIAILPYQEASQSGIIAAAQSYGLPCVVTPVGGLTDQVIDGKTGVVASSVEVDDLVEAAQRLLDDRLLYRRISERLLSDLAGNRDWEDLAECVVRFSEKEKK